MTVDIRQAWKEMLANIGCGQSPATVSFCKDALHTTVVSHMY